MALVITAQDHAVRREEIGAVEQVGAPVGKVSKHRAPEEKRDIVGSRERHDFEPVGRLSLKQKRCGGFRPDDQVAPLCDLSGQPGKAIERLASEGCVPLLSLIYVGLYESYRDRTAGVSPGR